LTPQRESSRQGDKAAVYLWTLTHVPEKHFEIVHTELAN
jgi:hypothetical protein